jgi:hypothetical protein
MKPQLTEAQIEKRIKTNKKIIKYSGIAALVIFGIPLIFSLFIDTDKINNDTAKATIDKAQKQLDSIIALIKTDQTIKTTKVEYRKDSVLEIQIPPKDEIVYAIAFDNLYKIMDIGIVSEIEVYQNKSLISSFGNKTQLKLEQFQNTFVSSFDGSCKPVIAYIKQNMNNPKSFELDKTFITPLVNGNFNVKTIFRGTNAFGGIVTNSCYSEVAPDGQIIASKIEQ